MFKNKTLLITGGTGSFGNKFIPMTLEKYNPKKIIKYARDEMKQWNMALEHKDEPRLQFVIGDVRDKDRLDRALNGVDIVIHAAALKQVPSAEYNPIEYIKTNILGAQNIIEAAKDENIEKVVALSTDKAVEPINAYGMAKALQERLITTANLYKDGTRTVFVSTRYGNVLGSRGSVVPLFKSLIET